MHKVGFMSLIRSLKATHVPNRGKSFNGLKYKIIFVFQSRFVVSGANTDLTRRQVPDRARPNNQPEQRNPGPGDDLWFITIEFQMDS